MELTFKHCLLKIVGVFAYDERTHNSLFPKAGYTPMLSLELHPQAYSQMSPKEREDAIDKTISNYKNIYYSEFRDFMFTGKDRMDVDGFRKEKISTFQRDKQLSGKFQYEQYKKEIDAIEIVQFEFKSERQEIYLFPDGIGIFALTLSPLNDKIKDLSQLINRARSFETEVLENDITIPFYKWISREILIDIPLVGDNLESDEYSGSKFKVYTVIDMPESSADNPYDRDHLLYEIGTSSPIGSVAGFGFAKPSETYYQELLQNKLSAFHNYEGIGLLDSFTVIGTNNYRPLNSNTKDFAFHNWNRVYFGIYMYNLFVRYSLFKFNAQFLSDPVKYRDKFQRFLNNYDFRHISFNFLPNMIFDRMRQALGVNEEIEVFEKRLSNLASTIQEDQEKRQAFLLTLISVISALDATEAIMGSIENVRARLEWGMFSFYSIFIILLLTGATFVLRYLFPHHAKKVERYTRKKLKRRKEK
jgi:hypothetical protein